MKRFIPRYSLSSLLIGTAICAACFGAYHYVVVIWPHDQRELVRKINAGYGFASYDFEIPVSAPEHSWKSGLANILSKDAVGLVRSVQITKMEPTEDLYTILKGLKSLDSVKFLSLEGTALDEKAIEIISEMSPLTELIISHRYSPAPKNINQLRKLTNLEYLGLSSWKDLPNDTLAELSSLPHLKELGLEFTNISSRQVEDLAKYPSLE